MSEASPSEKMWQPQLVHSMSGTHSALHPTQRWLAGPPQETLGRERYHAPGAACDVCSGWLQAARVRAVARRPPSASSAGSCGAQFFVVH